jgi:hypothetical protein
MISRPLWLLLGLGLVVVPTLLFLVDAFPDPCGNQVVSTITAPDGQKKAVVFQRDCGATTGFSTQISILPLSHGLPNEGGNVFIADCDHGAAPAAAHGGPEVHLSWAGSNRLEVRFHPKARVFRSVPSLDDVEITYVPSLATPSR